VTAGAYGSAYSKGNRQKVLLIAALSSRADLLILDEPTTGLDPLMEETFRECVAEARRRWHSGIGFGVMMQAGLNITVPALFILGAGTLLYGLVPLPNLACSPHGMPGREAGGEGRRHNVASGLTCPSGCDEAHGALTVAGARS
jgi:hypothetical protein